MGIQAKVELADFEAAGGEKLPHDKGGAFLSYWQAPNGTVFPSYAPDHVIFDYRPNRQLVAELENMGCTIDYV